MRLYTLNEIEQIQQDIPYVKEVLEWVKSFLAKRHPHLGRSGSVCPFVPYALKADTIQMAVIHTRNLDLQQLEDIVIHYRDVFLETEPKDHELAIYKSFLLIFPDIHADDTAKLIDGVQQKLKPLFVELGLMLGEFHKRNETAGLHNPNFHPLRSPIPLLAIRFMVESDLPFLQNATNPHLRIRYLDAYLKYFGHHLTDETSFENIHQALELAKAQLKSENLVNS